MVFDNMEFHNVEELEQTERGKILWRLPEAVRKNLNERAGMLASCYGTGVEIRFKMQEDSVRLILSAEELEEANVAYLYYGSIQGGWQNSSRMIKGEPTEITIRRPKNMDYLKELSKAHQLPFSPEVVRVVLPYGKIRYWGVEGKTEPPCRQELPKKTYLAYGSSITHGSLALAMPYSYPFRISQKQKCDYLNFGFAGCAQMETEMAEYLVSRKDWDFATVEMGINMIKPEYQTEEFEKRIDRFTKILSEDPRPVFATSLYGFSDPKFVERGAEYRKIVEKYAKDRLIFTDGLKLLNNPLYLSQDMTHPSLEGMEKIAQNWCEVFRQHGTA